MPNCYIMYNPPYRILHLCYSVSQMPILSPAITPADMVPVFYSDTNVPIVACNHSCLLGLVLCSTTYPPFVTCYHSC